MCCYLVAKPVETLEVYRVIALNYEGLTNSIVYLFIYIPLYYLSSLFIQCLTVSKISETDHFLTNKTIDTTTYISNLSYLSDSLIYLI